VGRQWLAASVHSPPDFHRGLISTWAHRLLDGAALDTDPPDFVTEADYQTYIDRYTWPFRGPVCSPRRDDRAGWI
jgi:hypothetical protein